jgi:lipopolysaccharide transport system ATP-binding protein
MSAAESSQGVTFAAPGGNLTATPASANSSTPRPVLRVAGLGKAFRKYRSEWQRALSWFGVPVTPRSEQWALRDVSFDVAAGQAVGIVGQNGAGKSTLLKLVAGTLRASEGGVSIDGRIAAILELGMGFNPEFTGRQNVLHATGLMGFGPDAIARVLPDIEAFAEVGAAFDRPMRTYSSGMQMRVAFAVATAVRPEVLIVDEALSVGDAYFQHKSLGRIRQFKEQGTALLFVTHSMADIRTLCDRVILLDRGRIVRDGLPDEVIDYYNALIALKENERASVDQVRRDDGWLRTRSGTGEASLFDFTLTDANSGEAVQSARVGQRLVLTCRVRVREAIPQLVLGYMLRDRLGHVVWGTNTWHTGQVVTDLRGGQIVEFRLPFSCTLGPGSYSFSPALVSSDTHLANNYEWTDNALVFEVINADRDYFIGSNWLDAAFEIRRDATE